MIFYWMTSVIHKLVMAEKSILIVFLAFGLFTLILLNSVFVTFVSYEKGKKPSWLGEVLFSKFREKLRKMGKYNLIAEVIRHTEVEEKKKEALRELKTKNGLSNFFNIKKDFFKNDKKSVSAEYLEKLHSINLPEKSKENDDKVKGSIFFSEIKFFKEFQVDKKLIKKFQETELFINKANSKDEHKLILKEKDNILTLFSGEKIVQSIEISHRFLISGVSFINKIGTYKGNDIYNFAINEEIIYEFAGPLSQSILEQSGNYIVFKDCVYIEKISNTK